MSVIKYAIPAFLLLVECHIALGQTSYIRTVDVFPKNLLNMQFGFGWPHKLDVVEGHEVTIKLEGKLDNVDTCVVTTPTGQEFEVHSPPSNRYQAWGDGCGLRVKNVMESDEGRWRINATAGNQTLAGWAAIVVNKDSPASYAGPEIELRDGATSVVELTTLDNSYCVVAQPFSESALIPGHCMVTLDKATRAVQGNWNVLLGVPGRVQEIAVQRKVAVESERLDTGYIRDTNLNKLHLYCNILNTEKNITFCRFQKTSSSVGYNVLDGLSDGAHSYYGDGFFRRDCGMTVERPTAEDYGTWRCSVGVQQWAGNQIREGTPLQALISVGPDNPNRINSFIQHMNDDEIPTVFVQEDQSFTVTCRADESLSYCWFQHPNGTSFTPVPIETEDQPFWYTGENLQVGDCGITFSHATNEETGLWTCHMGPSDTLGLEVTKKVEVRVTGPLAANRPRIATYDGDTVHLYCHTANGNKPLDYCRFLSPSGLGFRIDSTVTEESPILERFFFMADKNVDYGDCALTIKGVMEEDIGVWTCAALINDAAVEASDTIELYLASNSDTLKPSDPVLPSNSVPL
ncbi:hypothetical protein NE865_06626 [Phthorimaea operculella]|nr:hypothetical protein NE865_06626 [Phthorimaea operculella]